ncbi:hypothetical protein Q8F55_004259 [Vanrija albida]|uniref:Fe2OG dioxygenase domain-containing protein n=1 Tax=Vanrija albida TaxID=181172 RepID=A0ABR3Q7D5_9TREE
MEPPLCLQRRFVSPALAEVFKLRPARTPGADDAWAAIFADALEGALQGPRGAEEAALEAEFHALLPGPPAQVTAADRRFRARVLYAAFGGARGGLERAEAMVRARVHVAEEHVDSARAGIGGGVKRREEEGGGGGKRARGDAEESRAEKRKRKEEREVRREERRKEKEGRKRAREEEKGERKRVKAARREGTKDDKSKKAKVEPESQSEPESEPEPAPKRQSKRLKPARPADADGAPAPKRKRESPSDAAFEPDATPAPTRAPSLPLAIEKRRAPVRHLFKPISDDVLVKLGLMAAVPRPKPKRKPTAKQAKAADLKAEAASPPPAPPAAARRPSPPPPGSGIRASTFTAVLRLVADLRRAAAPPRPARHEPRGRPPVWAQTRQELCEALPYYRAFQSGMYMSKHVAYGYLLDGFPAPRDVWAAGGRVIISHGGGQSTRTLDTRGQPVSCLLADHSAKSDRIGTLLAAAERRAPVVLLAGAEYALLPFRLGCTYAVLGWYWVSAAWFEAAPPDPGAAGSPAFFRRLKVRFDWVESQGAPWWDGGGAKPDIGSLMAPVPPAATTPPSRGTSVFAAPPATPPSPDTSALSTAPPTAPTSPAPPKHRPNPLPTPPDSLAELDPPPSKQLVQLQLWGGRSVSNHYVDLERPNSGAYASPLPGSYRPGTSTLANAHTVRPTGADTELFPGATCPTCHAHSPRLYAEGWICVQPSCAQFWMLATPRGLFPVPLGMALTYDPAFLEPAETPPHRRSVPYSVVPPAPGGAETGEAADDGQSGSRTLWKGWVCSACGRANCRYRWERWECRACGNRLEDAGAIVPAPGLPPRVDILGEDDDCTEGVLMSVRRLASPPATVVAYVLPRAGTVYHILHDNSHPADAIWEAYQRAAVDAPGSPLFERRELKSNTVKGGLLSQQFAINSGASYKYIVETLSYTFAESPPSVMDALQLIRERVASVLGERVEFNEILSVMYREGQKMNWHDDSEPGLGPVVAALSLGSPATMSFRRKTKTRRNKPAAAASSKEQTRRPQAVLNFALSHGDVVIMAGRAIQHMYDHKVVPLGLRVAATARVIQGQVVTASRAQTGV